MFLACSTISRRRSPRAPLDCSDQSSVFVNCLTLLASSDRGQREIPSANAFCTPGICFASYLQPPRISRRPSILIIRPARLSLARLSLAPPHRFAQVTAAKLSQRIKMGSPLDSRWSPTSSCMAHAVSTIPTSSSKLIVTLHVSRRAALRFSPAESARGESYLQ